MTVRDTAQHLVAAVRDYWDTSGAALATVALLQEGDPERAARDIARLIADAVDFAQIGTEVDRITAKRDTRFPALRRMVAQVRGVALEAVEVSALDYAVILILIRPLVRKLYAGLQQDLASDVSLFLAAGAAASKADTD
jgi:hypothetical protein